MSRQTVLNLINAIWLGKQKVSPVRGEIAKFIFLIRAWEKKALELQGSTMRQTEKNIEKWINDFNNTYRQNMANIDVLSGYGGWAFARLPDEKDIGKKLFLESYRTRMMAVMNRDFTNARMLSNGLQKKWGNGKWERFYSDYDKAIIEGKALGLTTSEINRGFKKSGIYNEFVILEDRIGRKWNPEFYTEMYSRTRSAEVEDVLFREEWVSLGEDIVRVSSHNTSTPICMKYEGKYFSLTGETENIPILQIRPPFHPNCLHRLIPKRGIKESVMVRENRTIDKKFASKSLSSTEKKTIRNQEAWNKKHRT